MPWGPAHGMTAKCRCSPAKRRPHPRRTCSSLLAPRHTLKNQKLMRAGLCRRVAFFCDGSRDCTRNAARPVHVLQAHLPRSAALIILAGGRSARGAVLIWPNVKATASREVDLGLAERGSDRGIAARCAKRTAATVGSARSVTLTGWSCDPHSRIRRQSRFVSDEKSSTPVDRSPTSGRAVNRPCRPPMRPRSRRWHRLALGEVRHSAGQFAPRAGPL